MQILSATLGQLHQNLSVYQTELGAGHLALTGSLLIFLIINLARQHGRRKKIDNRLAEIENRLTRVQNAESRRLLANINSQKEERSGPPASSALQTYERTLIEEPEPTQVHLPSSTEAAEGPAQHVRHRPFASRRSRLIRPGG